MRIPIIDIGNSKGIRIPQAILKQARFGQEVELDLSEGGITLKRAAGAAFAPDFDQIPNMDDESIQRLLRSISGIDLMTALVGARPEVKEPLYRNLSPRAREYLQPTVERLESGDARDLIIERSRNLVCEAMIALSRA
jgi:antitoxin component of MazEF toxin-antitoxin module